MTLQGDVLKDAIGQTQAKWGWFVGLGVLLLILGGIAFGNLFIATVASVYVVGWLMLMAGVIEIMHALGVKTWSRFFYWLLSGLLYAVAGFFAFYNPLLASAVLTFLLAVALLASGVLRAWVGYKHRPAKGWGWLVAAGIISALAGLVIAMGWPVNSVWVLGLFLAIDLIFQGWAFIAVGLALKK
ncbi:HdeD family acid-resistance protein [Mesorhizobium sp. M6A.T.Ce.TU.002.03.1.1]|uniref:HdeD family acid-resistance protein n=1 Tax=unclassified Mesorhizobium TaxID=325217 RepID=UPI000FC9C18D|nr:MULTISPECIES: HdeD family acid-resistance protein [unclassified Mesorhizobium]RUU47598.1 HdeD family acid-resistance protein [Mesorhizobium sp. M6A.T.Ca.TU.002.02.2.1]RUU44354.1 HdeD family acid-resistance protein [Mesorhizobium sp. M6A.T.Ce.TU.002.03.1.1]RUV00502.1 HdeD family acid-resistance protein [Mesorhizobium sp. M6A.T.Cr.TU.017.01.1.1]RWP73188.1 MAG: HdeD family acid-resistance protein [Mesorhizobium sp.]RWQ36228.1 MAG: HdeD family acid-resistance protein [Mesorhizobium sp.]